MHSPAICAYCVTNERVVPHLRDRDRETLTAESKFQVFVIGSIKWISTSGSRVISSYYSCYVPGRNYGTENRDEAKKRCKWGTVNLSLILRILILLARKYKYLCFHGTQRICLTVWYARICIGYLSPRTDSKS